MSEIARFEKFPGCDILRAIDNPGLLLVGVTVPAWVRLPDELGGERRNVRRAFLAPCPGPHCVHERDVRHLELDDAEHMHVSDCARCGFLWYQPRAPMAATTAGVVPAVTTGGEP
jgi:hypothetical protein